MSGVRQLASSCAVFFGHCLILSVVLWLISARLAVAQVPPAHCPNSPSSSCLGQNAVVLSTNPLTTLSSAAYVDATPYAGDICAAIQTILTAYNSNRTNGVVVDARGVNPGTSQTCTGSTANPWSGTNVPDNVVLLPPGTITTSASWILPSNTVLVGAGKNATTVKANFTGGAVIRMGLTGTIAFSVAVSDLTIDTNGTADGIDNLNAEELSYAKRVAVINVKAGKTGLFLGTDPSSGTSSHSGPYADLSISLSGTSTASSCISVFNAQPRGIHGISCTNSGTTTLTAGIYLDGTNTSVEDAYVSGSFTNGILVGSQTQTSSNNVRGNVLFNIKGSGVTNTVHVSNASLSGVPNVSDLTVMGATNSAGSNTVVDDLTGGRSLSDPSIGLYVVGEAVATSSTVGYSRFSTSTSTSSSAAFPSWIVGSGTPSHSCGTGSLYSRIANSSGHTLWGCAGNAWRLIN